MSNFGDEKIISNISETPCTEEAPAIVSTVVSEPPALKVIDWDEAIATAGDNMDFLKELITDLLNEARTAEDEIGEAIKASNYTAIMRAAHRIGGTCSYFCCEATLDVCHKLLGSKKISFPLQLEKRSSNIEILIGTLMI